MRAHEVDRGEVDVVIPAKAYDSPRKHATNKIVEMRYCQILILSIAKCVQDRDSLLGRDGNCAVLLLISRSI